MNAVRIALLPLLTAAALVAQEDPGPDLRKLRASYEEKLMELNAELTKFDDSFKGALERLKDAQSKGGNLQNAILVEKELETFSKGEFDVKEFRNRLSDFGELRKLQNTYLEEWTKASRRIEGPRTQLTRRYVEELERLQEGLTKSGKLSEALEVSKERDRAKDVFAQIAAGGEIDAKKEKVMGRLEYLSKGDIEIFLNGKKLNCRENEVGASIRLFGESQPREFAVGDTVVIGGKHRFVYRGIILAVLAEDESSFIRFRRKNLRLLPIDSDPRKVTKEIIESGHTEIAGGGLDNESIEAWEKRGIPAGHEGGSESFQGMSKGQHYYWGAIITDDMIQPWKKPEE